MDLYDKLLELGKRRGIFFPSFEIYGGVSGFYDYGPIGCQIKRRLEDRWRHLFVYREGMVELESPVIMPEKVFLASGHLAHFTDVLTKCTLCGRVYRVDHLLHELGYQCPEGLKLDELDGLLDECNAKCPNCQGQLAQVEPFNLMFQLNIGSSKGRQTGYGRPEAGQGQFVDFKRIYTSERERLPLGIAQVGKCVRNEIAPRKGPIRLREFTIIDYEIFIDPEAPSYPRINLVSNQKLRILTALEQRAGTNRVREITVQDALNEGLIVNEVLCYFMALAVDFLRMLGIPAEKQRLREQLSDERAHYSTQTFDQEVWLDGWGWTEVSGHAYRTDYDLRNHMAQSGVDLRVHKAFDKPKKTVKIQLQPIMERLTRDFGVENVENIVTLLSKSDPSIVERELRVKGFYEITGQHPVKLKPEHVEVTRETVEVSGRYFVPHVVEPSFGIDRIFYSILEYAYKEKQKRIVLALPKEIAATQVACFPLVSKSGLPELANQIYHSLLDEGFVASYDASGSIGRRYARSDEIGIPLCITVDYQSLNDNTITLRDLYTWKQIRVNVHDLPNLLHDYFRGKSEFHELGAVLT